MRTYSRKNVVLTAAVTAFVAAASYYIPTFLQRTASQAASLESKAATQQRQFAMLAERIQAMAYRQPTPEELEEEKRYNSEQALALTNDLHATNPAKRLEAAEQLGAYPSPEAEDLLSQSLAQDKDASVRETAAQTLGSLDKPSTRAIDALLKAIDDPSAEVQNASLLSLERLLNEDIGKALRSRILQGLERKARSGHLAKETKEYLLELLEQQTETAEEEETAESPPPPRAIQKDAKKQRTDVREQGTTSLSQGQQTLANAKPVPNVATDARTPAANTKR